MRHAGRRRGHYRASASLRAGLTHVPLRRRFPARAAERRRKISLVDCFFRFAQAALAVYDDADFCDGLVPSGGIAEWHIVSIISARH